MCRVFFMKVSHGLVGYFLCATGIVALGGLGLSYAISPDSTAQRAVTKRLVSPQASTKSVEEKEVPDDPNRVPVWIMPTQKYPASAFTVKNASRAKEAARGGRPNDWRLRERRPGFDAPTGMSAFADRDSRPEYESGYRDPMQFRERTEPR